MGKKGQTSYSVLLPFKREGNKIILEILLDKDVVAQLEAGKELDVMVSLKTDIKNVELAISANK
jgi:hypothetical protein